MSAPNEPKQRRTATNRSKKSRILAVLREGVSLNRFEAAAKHSDSCLNSTISQLRANGQNILDEWETFPNQWGSITRVKRYRHARPAGRKPSADQGVRTLK
jgi:hypothetical protein